MDFAALIAIVATLSGIALGWLGRARTVKKDVAKDTTAVVTLQNNVEYIRRGVDDILLDQKAQGQRIDSLSERVTRIEESAKQAHKRLDRLDE